MAIAKKGTRSIIVDGVKYRWRVPKDPTYSDCQTVWEGGKGSMRVVVENAETAGRALLIHLGQPHPSIGKYVAAVPIAPSQIAEWIRGALAQGWQAIEKGSVFDFMPEIE